MTSLFEAYRRTLSAPVLPIIWAVMSVFSVIAGPFGSLTSMSFVNRLIYWPLVIFFGILIGAALRVLVQQYLGLRRYLFEAPVIAVLASAVLATPCWALMLAMTEGQNPARPTLPVMALYVFVVSLAISTLRHAVRQNVEGGPAPSDPVEQMPQSTPAEGDGGVRLLMRIDPALRAPIVRLQVRDHYVDVVTEAGAASLLMRFADAMAELEGQPGLRVHRSHWVADQAVIGARRERGKLLLQMSDGAEVPVSKTYLPQVIERGLVAAD